MTTTAADDQFTAEPLRFCMDCGAEEGQMHHHNCATLERDPWSDGEERIDRIAQSDASGSHYPPTCADGLPCGVAHSPGDDAYCLRCPHEPLDAEGQEEFDASMRIFTEEPFPKQARYQDAHGEDWIDEFARTATPEEFRGAMRFTIGKYNRRAGKKDALVSEIMKIEDYARRWREYELARGGEQ